jgi:hypothetical protein
MPDKLRKKLKREWFSLVENISGINPEESPREFIKYFKAEYSDSKIADRFYSKVLKEIYKEAILVPKGHKAKSTKTAIEIQRGIDSDDRQFCLDDYNLKLAVLKIFKNYQAIKNYEIKVKRLTVADHSSDPDTLYLADIAYIPENFIAYYEKSLKNSIEDDLRKEPKYDSQNLTLDWGGARPHCFQKNGKDKSIIKLFNSLWENRKVIISGNVRRAGEAFAIETAMARARIVESAQKVSNIEIANLKTRIKNTNKNLGHKNCPVRIEQEGGIQIVVKI